MICRNGHAVTRSDLYVYTSGATQCRVCDRERRRREREADPDGMRARWREDKRRQAERRAKRERETYWTPGRVRELARLCREGYTVRQIAWILDRREPAVRCKIARLQLKAGKRPKKNDPARQRRA